MPGVTESDIRWILWEAGEVDAVPWLENGFVSSAKTTGDCQSSWTSARGSHRAWQGNAGPAVVACLFGTAVTQKVGIWRIYTDMIDMLGFLCPRMAEWNLKISLFLGFVFGALPSTWRSARGSPLRALKNGKASRWGSWFSCHCCVIGVFTDSVISSTSNCVSSLLFSLLSLWLLGLFGLLGYATFTDLRQRWAFGIFASMGSTFALPRQVVGRWPRLGCSWFRNAKNGKKPKLSCVTCQWSERQKAF